MSASYTPKQREDLASRTVSDAELIRDGATTAEDGTLKANTELIHWLHWTHMISPQVNEFLDTTEEGQQVSEHLRTLRGLGSALMWYRVDHRPEGYRGGFPTMWTPTEMPYRNTIDQYEGYCESNGIAIDFELLGDTSEQGRRAAFDHATSVLFDEYGLWTPDRPRLSFRGLIEGLITFPQFHLGSQVKAPALDQVDGNPLQLSDWTVRRVAWNKVGLLELGDQPVGYGPIQTASTDQLMDWNFS